MSETQAFKENDLKERKFENAVTPVLNLLSADRDSFYTDAYQCAMLGGVLYDLQRTPLTTVIKRDVFIASFYGIYDFFARPGTFEFFLTLFRTIWGPSVEVEFTVEPGKLLINIAAASVSLSDFIAREIVDNEYVFSEIVDTDGDNIAFQSFIGIKTQEEVDSLLKEINTAGIYTEIDFGFIT